jgi:hypothetical protein
MNEDRGFVRIMSMTAPGSMAIAGQILSGHDVPHVVHGDNSQYLYGALNSAMNAALLVERRYFDSAMELLEDLPGLLQVEGG